MEGSCEKTVQNVTVIDVFCKRLAVDKSIYSRIIPKLGQDLLSRKFNQQDNRDTRQFVMGKDK